MTDIDGLRVLVTGASTGIGAALSRKLKEHGASVAMLARRAELLAVLADEIDAFPICADLRDIDKSADAVRQAAELMGGLDAVVNNAGVFPIGLIADADVEDWTVMLETNVRGTLVVTKAAIPYLRESGRGQIVNISSMGGRRVASAVQGVYAGTKHALHAISEGLRRELFEDGIRVTVIAPGFVKTDLGKGIRKPQDRQDMAKGQLESGLDPNDVADQVVHTLKTPRSVTIVEIALTASTQRPV